LFAALFLSALTACDTGTGGSGTGAGTGSIVGTWQRTASGKTHNLKFSGGPTSGTAEYWVTGAEGGAVLSTAYTYNAPNLTLMGGMTGSAVLSNNTLILSGFGGTPPAGFDGPWTRVD
jgi:hypothetical protein